MNVKSDSSGAAIAVRDLRRRFGRQQVLNGVNLECPSGAITTIVPRLISCPANSSGPIASRLIAAIGG